MSDARARIHAMFRLDPDEVEELDARLDAYRVEVLLKAGVQYEDCPKCGAARAVGQDCHTCAFKARMAAEARALPAAAFEAGRAAGAAGQPYTAEGDAS